MRMNLAMAGINHEPFKVGFIYQNFKQFFPNAFVAPPDKAAMGIAPVPKIWRKVTPGSPGTHNPKDCIDK